jgi:hypothetical protein
MGISRKRRREHNTKRFYKLFRWDRGNTSHYSIGRHQDEAKEIDSESEGSIISNCAPEYSASDETKLQGGWALSHNTTAHQDSDMDEISTRPQVAAPPPVPHLQPDADSIWPI